MIATHSATSATATTNSLSAKAWGVVIVGLVLWWSLVHQLKTEWSINAQYSYGWGVPWLALYLAWKKWPLGLAPVAPTANSIWPLITGTLLLLALLPIRLVQEANPDWRLVSWMFAIDVVALTLLSLWWLAGKEWLRILWLPIAFILIAVPWPTPIEQMLIQNLMQGVAAITVEIVNWFGYPAIQHGNVIDLPTGMVGVSEACSGVRSFQSTLMASIFLGELYRFNLRHRLLTIIAGAILSLGFNVVRTLALTWVNIQKGEAGHDAWHDPAGYLVLACAFASLWLICIWFEKIERNKASRQVDTALSHQMGEGEHSEARSQSEKERANSSVLHWNQSFARFPLWLVATWLIAAEAGVQGWYAAHESKLSKKTTWKMEWPKDEPGLSFDRIPEETQILLRYSSGKAAHWRPTGSPPQWLIYYFEWAPGRAAAQLARNHSPEACLPAGGLKLVKQLENKTFNVAGLNIPFRVYRFEADGRPCLVYFCLWEDRASGPHQAADYSRSSRLDAVRAGERHLGQRVLEIAMLGESDEAIAQQSLEKFLQRTIRVP